MKAFALILLSLFALAWTWPGTGKAAVAQSQVATDQDEDSSTGSGQATPEAVKPAKKAKKARKTVVQAAATDADEDEDAAPAKARPAAKVRSTDEDEVDGDAAPADQGRELAPKQQKQLAKLLKTGQKLLQRRYYPKALACFQKALRLDPDNQAALDGRDRCNQALGGDEDDAPAPRKKAHAAGTSNALNNRDVKHLLDNGMTAAQVVKAIRTSPGDFDLSPEGRADLKEAGVPKAVVQAMADKMN